MKSGLVLALLVVFIIPAQADKIPAFTPEVKTAFHKILVATDLDQKEHAFVVNGNGSITYSNGGFTSVQMQVPSDAQMMVHTHPRCEINVPSNTDIKNERGRPGIMVVLGYARTPLESFRMIYVITPDGKVSLAGMMVR